MPAAPSHQTPPSPAPAAPISSSAPHQDPHAAPLAAAVRVVSGLTLVSRFAGLARDVITARLFGDGALGSAFRAAYALPNFFRRLFGEGALTAAFLPEYALARRDDPARAAALASLVVRLVTLATGALTLLAELVLLLRLAFLPASPDLSLSIRLIMLLLPMMPAVCLTAILGGILQAHGRFAIPAAAPIVLNLFQIAAGALFALNLVHAPNSAAYAVGASALLASAACVAWSLWALRATVRWTDAFSAAKDSGRRVLRRFLPAVLGLGTLQLNTFLDMLIAMWPIWVGATMFGRATPLDAASNSILSYTQTLYQFPLGVFGIAVATAVFPLLARSADRDDDFTQHLRRGIRLSLFIGLPASLGLLAVRHELVAVIFGGGKKAFSEDGLARSAAVLAGFAPAVWAYSLNHVLTRAFYAKGDTTTPMRVALVCVAINLALNLSLIWPLREAGLAWATATSAIVQCATLLFFVRRRLSPRLFDPTTLRACFATAAASIAMVAGVVTLRTLLPAGDRWSDNLFRLASCVGAGAALFTAFAWLLNLPELRWLLHPSPAGKDAAAGMSFE